MTNHSFIDELLNFITQGLWIPRRPKYILPTPHIKCRCWACRSGQPAICLRADPTPEWVIRQRSLSATATPTPTRGCPTRSTQLATCRCARCIAWRYASQQWSKGTWR